MMSAEMLNRSGSSAWLSPGAIADVLLVDGNPLEGINVLEGQGEHLSVIMKGGALYKNRLN